MISLKKLTRVVREIQSHEKLIPDEPELLLATTTQKKFSSFDKDIYYSPFEEENKLWDKCFSTGIVNNVLADVRIILIRLFFYSETEEKPFNFKKLDAVAASKSSNCSFHNSRIWKSFEEFGHYTYYEYLQNDDEKLLKIFKQAQDKVRFYKVKYQQWCNRNILINNGRSHRYAACSYLAKNHHPDFLTSINLPIVTEHLDRKVFTELDNIGSSYTITAHKDYHNELFHLFLKYKVPCIFFELFPHRSKPNNIVTKVYILLNEEYFCKTHNSSYSYFYTHKRETIRIVKRKLDDLNKKGYCPDFATTINTIIEHFSKDTSTL